jgi:hypothetical protein
MNEHHKEAASKRWAIGMLAGGIVFLSGWRGVVAVARHFNEPRLVREFDSIRQFEQDLNPNGANTRLVFCQDTKDGVGIYYCDTAGGKPRLLCEQAEKGRGWKRFTLLGWTPDDSLFACAFPERKNDQELILIFDGRTGELLSKVVADQSLVQLGWLSNESFAYSVGGSSVRVVRKQPNGEWAHKRFLENVATNMGNFTVVSANVVAWRDNEGIRQLNLDSGSSERIWEATTNRLMEFSYSSAGDEFLLNCSDVDGQYLLRFRPVDQRTISLGKISSHHAYIRKARWNGKRWGYACLTNDPAGSAFCVRTSEIAAPVIIPWQGGLRSFTLNGNHLFFSGSPDGEAPGIWDYDLGAATVKCIVGSATGTLNHGIGSRSTSLVLTNSFGEQRYCHLWTPPRVVAGHKYPVLLAQEFNEWFPYWQIAAQSGFYVAVADRPFYNSWDGERTHTWAEDVSRLREVMAQNPSVDTNRVYLYACSAETVYLCRLIEERPALARGVILFSPGALPDPTMLHDKHILIVDGKADGDAMKRLSEFQDRAAEKGNDITLFLQDGAGHVNASGTTECNRAREFSRYLADKRW